MNLVKSIFEVRFELPTRPWTEVRELLRVIAADANAELQAAPMVIDRPTEKKRIVLQIRAVTIERESGDSVEQINQQDSSIVKELHSISPFPAVRTFRHTAMFIEAVSVPFYDLVKAMKAYYLRPTTTSNESSDIGLTFYHMTEHVLRRIEIGPMDKTQLETEILRWPSEEIPSMFAFFGLHYESKGTEEYSHDRLLSFFREAGDWYDETKRVLAQELEEVLSGNPVI